MPVEACTRAAREMGKEMQVSTYARFTRAAYDTNVAGAGTDADTVK